MFPSSTLTIWSIRGWNAIWCLTWPKGLMSVINRHRLFRIEYAIVSFINVISNYRIKAIEMTGYSISVWETKLTPQLVMFRFLCDIIYSPMHIHTHEMIASDMPLTTHRIRSRKGSYIHLEVSMAARNRYYYSNHGNLFRYRPKAIERPLQNLKTGPKELAQTPLMRQLSEPFLAERGN